MPSTCHISQRQSDFYPHGSNWPMEDLFKKSQDLQYKELHSSIIGYTRPMLEVKRRILALAKSDLTVLIRGETGTGKELVARAIHNFSPRGDKPFIKVHCPALPADLLESELFGFEKGAFTGAFKKKPGKFQLAHTGTILLDEIGEVPLPVQTKLLQAIETKEFSPLGSSASTKTDVRVLAATNADLNEMVSRGVFRRDLYYRLNVVAVHIPPLRERREDIDMLCDHFLKKYAARYGKECNPLPERMQKRFYRYCWPGNVRELEGAITCITAIGNAEAVNGRMSTLRKRYLLKEVRKEAVSIAERNAILDALYHSHWNRKKAASLLKTSYKNLLSKIREYKIVRKNRNDLAGCS